MTCRRSPGALLSTSPEHTGASRYTVRASGYRGVLALREHQRAVLRLTGARLTEARIIMAQRVRCCVPGTAWPCAETSGTHAPWDRGTTPGSGGPLRCRRYHVAARDAVGRVRVTKEGEWLPGRGVPAIVWCWCSAYCWAWSVCRLNAPRCGGRIPSSSLRKRSARCVAAGKLRPARCLPRITIITWQSRRPPSSPLRTTLRAPRPPLLPRGTPRPRRRQA